MTFEGILKKIYYALKGRPPVPPVQPGIAERFAERLTIDSSSILNEQSSFYFNPHLPATEQKKVFIGKKCLLTAHFIFETGGGKITIGDNVYMGGVKMISKSEITIGNNVTMAWGIFIYDHDAHSVDWAERSKDNERCYNDYHEFNGNLNVTKDWSVVRSKPIRIEDSVWIGFDSLILKGVTIGKGAVVAAKSVVTKDVPAWTLVAGNPAQVVKQLNRYD